LGGYRNLRLWACFACAPPGLTRINRELRRRTRCLHLPNPDSCLGLISALLAELDDEWMTAKVYLNLNP
jgi:transposase-like protein